MICTIHNIAPSTRVIYSANTQEIAIAPSAIARVNLDEGTYKQLILRTDMVVTLELPGDSSVPVIASSNIPAVQRIVPPPPPPRALDAPPLPALVVTGHFGIGDNLHQRAVMRELMKSSEVWLHTCHYNIFHDLIEQGLKLILRPTSLHAQAKTLARERHLFSFPPPPGK